ncbi:MarR family transcriptional regulator [Paenibacillus bovis]|uniref:MarR family transcriptional regulator n=1 Tax=Paenibacillus bovis TaxID=1616788 RepID=A0A172ZHM5_9BACL|nr:MarR family transcriptional regulator [Paenibacillus bovis]ANF97144.1 MarR family transcriptional regulator [Paenibacillus bovis]
MNKQEQVMTEFRELFNKMAWLNKYKMEHSLEGYKPSEVHCIDYIGKHAECNVTRLAESLYMTRGAISKITKKLIDRQLIQSYQKQDNKKEIYFRLTDQGESVFAIHDRLHREFQQRDQIVFDQITDEQFDSMLRFIEKYSQHLDQEIQKQGISIN